MNNAVLYSKLVSLPDDLKAEVADFVDFLAARREKKQARKRPRFGSGSGMFVMQPDFDEPLEDFKEYMA